MAPAGVAAGFACGRWRQHVAVEPARNVIVIELLAPYHSGKRLPHHCRLIIARAMGRERRIVLVSLPAAIGMNLLKTGTKIECASRHVARKAKPELDGFTCSDRDAIPECHFGAMAGRIHRVRAMDDMIVDAILGVGRLLFQVAIEVPGIGLVLAKEWRWRAAGRVEPGNEP